MNKEDNVLQAFGSMLGLPGLKFDDSRVCQLRVEGLKLALYDNRARKSITILCELSDQSMSRAEVDEWQKFMFSAQFSFLQKDTAVVGLNAASGEMVAMNHVTDDELSILKLSMKSNELIEWVLECSHQFSTRLRQTLVDLPSSTRLPVVSLSRGRYA
ncbi:MULTISPECIES: CesT family type III secretion system chaperone [Pseudomonas]|jgi:hypothetical protein|uniref:CesT family type III secretion system chaperone n=1 Tax=Pseudomonas TaxID=286 RepID=UPI0006ACCE29|nr:MULTISPECIES: CesT family type III secretion system chaperone [Pseudomonas]NWE00226.1 CesT family type III secretion system chaperone [Pseudomonas sp. IPO3749]NWF18714.1 CesT family type III secretion system chaperone [Pseudomonas sp. IPO3749]